MDVFGPCYEIFYTNYPFCSIVDFFTEENLLVLLEAQHIIRCSLLLKGFNVHDAFLSYNFVCISLGLYLLYNCHLNIKFEQVSDLGPRALAISLPFSCVLGLLSSMIASTMVSRSYIWAYASFQFAVVILFAHIFYSVLNVNPILAVLLSSFTGFGIAISTNSLIVEYLRWRMSRQMQSLHQQINGTVQHRRRQQDEQQNHQIHQQQQQQLTEDRSAGPANNSRQQ